MKRAHIVLVSLLASATFLLVYTPHYSYPYPSHIDEWHHITEASKLQNGDYSGDYKGFRFGFHLLLLLLSKVSNLVLIYKYLPALWAVFTVLILFYTVYKKTGGQFYLALWAMLFFASIKSNVNITGLWFFSALTFSIPFIYLYIYFFTEGIEKENKKFILASLIIMLFLIPLHSISVLFALPFLFLYSFLNIKFIAKNWKLFCGFLLVPVTGMIFYQSMTKIPWQSLLQKLIYAMQFKRGWGVLELNNSPFELYSLVGYILAVIGIVAILISKTNRKKYFVYVLWPLTVLISIIFYRIKGISYLSPYQRNLYYFAISLPLLSAFGLDCVLKVAQRIFLIEKNKKSLAKKVVISLILAAIVFFTFKSYWNIPRQIALYEVIDKEDYDAILFLKQFPKKVNVLAIPSVSNAIYAISGHNPIGTYYFYGNRKECERFFLVEKCQIKQEILNKYKVKYLLSKFKIDCGWKLIYDKGDYIYEVN